MDIECKKNWQSGMPCRSGPPSPVLPERVGLTRAPPTPSTDAASPGSIAFGAPSGSDRHLSGGIYIPGYSAPAFPVKPVRDPSLSLVALSGIDPSGPVMVEVPLVQNNTTFTPDRSVTGLRVGVAAPYERGDGHSPIEHRALFVRALENLRLAGVERVQVPALCVDDTLQFNLHTRHAIDALFSQYRLDALVSDSQSAAFDPACWVGCPRLGEPLGDGTTLWFYGERGSKGALPNLVQAYRSACRLTAVQGRLPGALNNPTF